MTDQSADGRDPRLDGGGGRRRRRGAGRPAGQLQIGTLAGWDVAPGVCVAWTWASIWHRDPPATARLALREAPGRPVTDALLLVASVALSWTVVQTVLVAGLLG
jgi:hypothetical protein